MQALAGTGTTPRAAAASLQAKIDAVFAAALDAMTARHTAFDYETSGRIEPAVQERWMREMNAELAR